MDCEFVGAVFEGVEASLPEFPSSNFHGLLIYDRFVEPREKATDWRAFVSGFGTSNIKNTISFEEAQTEVA